MENSLLFTLLSTLSRKERRQFRKFLATPYFNERKDIPLLFDYLSECQNDLFVIPKKEQVFRKVYKNQEYNDTQLRLAMSYCYKHLEHFLTYQAYFSEEIKNKTTLSQIYRERNLPKHFKKTIRDTHQLLEKSKVRNADYYNNNLQILQEEYQFTSITERTGAQNLQEISDHIDIAYFTSKFRQVCFSLSHQAVYKTEYDFGMLSEMIHYIKNEKPNLLDIPAIAIYYYCYHAFTKPEETHYFEKLKSALFQYPELFPKAEIRDLFLLTTNYCIKRINEGNKKFEKEVLDLYKEGLRQKYLMTNGILSRFTYLNITTIGLIQKDYDWVEAFNLDYKNHLEKQFRETSYSINTARLEYARKNYSTVLALLQKSDYKDVLLNLDAKTIALKTYFELQEIDLLESHMDAMKNFIRRKKIIGYHQENYLKLIQFTKQLLEVPVYDKVARARIRADIVSVKSVAERRWLLEQV